MEKKKLVVLTGAGMSADSGIRTFRDSGGLWEGADVMEVASIEGWHQNPEKVLDFYNERRKQLAEAAPNEGHKALVALEEKYDVTIVTQNVDDLHERAGSHRVIHLHGELTKVRPEYNEHPVLDIGYSEIHMGDTDERGEQLRPNIVWFGEMVPMMDVAIKYVSECDVMVIIGTSLVVYPAAGLVELIPSGNPIYVIDKTRPEYRFPPNMRFIQHGAATGTPKLVEKLLNRDSV